MIWFSANTCRTASARTGASAGKGPRAVDAMPTPEASTASPTQYAVSFAVPWSFMGSRQT